MAQVTENMLEVALAAYLKVWDAFPKAIDVGNVEIVRREAMLAALSAAMREIAMQELADLGQEIEAVLANERSQTYDKIGRS